MQCHPGSSRREHAAVIAAEWADDVRLKPLADAERVELMTAWQHARFGPPLEVVEADGAVGPLAAGPCSHRHEWELCDVFRSQPPPGNCRI